MKALVNTMQPGTSRARADWDLVQFVVGRTGFEDRCVRVLRARCGANDLSPNTERADGVGSAGAPT